MECSPGAGNSDIGQAFGMSRISSKCKADVTTQEDVGVAGALTGVDGLCRS